MKRIHRGETIPIPFTFRDQVTRQPVAADNGYPKITIWNPDGTICHDGSDVAINAVTMSAGTAGAGSYVYVFKCPADHAAGAYRILVEAHQGSYIEKEESAIEVI